MGEVLGKLFRFYRLHLLSIVQKMEAAKLVELEKKLKKEQGSVTKERLEELLVEAIDPTKAAIVVDLIFSALDLPEDGSIDVDMLDRLVEPSSGEMVKQRLAWIRGSNMGFSTPIVGGVNTAGRKRPMTMPTSGSIEQKNPVR